MVQSDTGPSKAHDRASREARAWWDRRRRGLTIPETRAFVTWMGDPANDAAYAELERKVPQDHDRYFLRPTPKGFAVVDRHTGKPAVFAQSQMVDLEVEDANEVAKILTLRDIRMARRR